MTFTLPESYASYVADTAVSDLPPSTGPGRMLVHRRFLGQAGWPA